MQAIFGTLVVHDYETRLEAGREAARDAARRINGIIKEKGYANLVFAAAPSQNEFLAALKTMDIAWENTKAFHMDEYVGLDKDAPQGFGNFLKAALFKDANFKEVHYLTGHAGTYQEQCAAYVKLLKDNPPDIIFLGVGENGHLAFNDPSNAIFDDPEIVKIVELETVCRQQQVNDGCFTCLEQVPTHALTITMSAIMRCAHAVAVVPGSLKAKAVKAMLTGPISTACPASILRTHKNAVMYLDKDSASLLKN